MNNSAKGVDTASRESNGSFRVLVIGAGIGGLAIAHATDIAKRNGELKNVDVTVFEKRGDESRFQRYPIHIAPDGRSALSSILSSEEHERLLQRSAHGVHHGGITLFTPKWSKLFGVRRYEGEEPQFVHRWVLKEILEERVHVVRGKRCLRIEEAGKGKVAVAFDDGSTEIADLVVGADGLGSTIRSTLYPSHARFDRLSYIVVQMKLLARSIAGLPIDQHGINMVLGRSSYSVLLVPFHGTPLPPSSSDEDNPFLDPLTSIQASSSPNAILTALDQDTPEYLFLNTTLPVFEGWDAASPQELVERISSLLKKDGADDRLLNLLEEDHILETVGAWQIVSCDESNPVPFGSAGGRVVLIGDAAHAMPPQGGVGGSTALKDAQLLVEALVGCREFGRTDGTLNEVLSRFHKEMINRSHGHMKDAKRRLYLSNRSGIRVYTRNVLLRVMNFFWPLANWVLNRGRESARKVTAKELARKKKA